VPSPTDPPRRPVPRTVPRDKTTRRRYPLYPRTCRVRAPPTTNRTSAHPRPSHSITNDPNFVYPFPPVSFACVSGVHYASPLLQPLASPLTRYVTPIDCQYDGARHVTVDHPICNRYLARDEAKHCLVLSSWRWRVHSLLGYDLSTRRCSSFAFGPSTH